MHADVDISKVRTINHQQEMEESHKNPEVVPTIAPKDYPKTLEMMEEYIRIFSGVDGQTLIYGLRDNLEHPAAASNPTYRTNGSKYFTHDE